MNVEKCANCLLNGWKQPQNQDDLQKCKRCKQIRYCGKECQMEHWQKLHKRQCRFFTDPTLTQKFNHNEATCVICLRAAGVDKRELRNPANPNYFCLYKSVEWEILMESDFLHTHPFQVTGQPGNTKEKAILVLWHLVYKFQECQPKVVQMFQDGLEKINVALTMERVLIWKGRKIYAQPDYYGFPGVSFIDQQFWMDVNETTKRSMTVVDPFQLWKSTGMVATLARDGCILRMLRTLKDPLNTLPVELRELISRGLENIPKYLSLVNQVLDALVSQVVPFQDILKIICGGSLKQKCSCCSKEVIITGIASLDMDGPVAFFDILFIGSFICGSRYCDALRERSTQDKKMLLASLVSALGERQANQCDSCFLVPPVGDVHRCSKCLSKMYCSKTCQLEDWKIHKNVCKEDVEQRKIKRGGEEREAGARGTREGLKKIESIPMKEACEMLEKLDFKKAKKKSKKKRS